MTSRFRAALVVAAVLALVLPALAIAHAGLVESDPADGATITTPYTLTATFAEEIDPETSTLIVKDASGAEVAAGSVNAADLTTMTADLPQLPDGAYMVSWTTVTPDDTGIERGTFTFTVAAAGATPAPTPIVITPGATGSNDVLLALLLAAIGIGAVVLFVFLRGRR
jgi:methionine-rich copper-binding protein CopC